jgi:hypothetical protein
LKANREAPMKTSGLHLSLVSRCTEVSRNFRLSLNVVDLDLDACASASDIGVRGVYAPCDTKRFFSSDKKRRQCEPKGIQ